MRNNGIMGFLIILAVIACFNGINVQTLIISIFVLFVITALIKIVDG